MGRGALSGITVDALLILHLTNALRVMHRTTDASRTLLRATVRRVGAHETRKLPVREVPSRRRVDAVVVVCCFEFFSYVFFAWAEETVERCFFLSRR